jgi:3-(3-hydroxy-phenyl)propionate hydroxylase
VTPVPHAQPQAARTPATDVDVLIVGAGPVGLTLANILGLHGVRTEVVEERDRLIDYPRGVGLDDESLRAFQGIGLVDRVLPHTTPNQILRFVDARRRVLAEISPSEETFGWPRRNGFVQPMVDAELLDGLDRFECVRVSWARSLRSFTPDDDGVTVDLNGAAGPSTVRARWVVGSDGGRSLTRRLLDVPFEGTTSPTR